MNNTEIIKGIEKTIEGLNTIKSALLGADADVKETATEKKEEKKTVTKKEEKAVAEEPATTGAVQYSEEELRGMKYNEFKKYASSLGVKCTGTRDEIMERILALDNAVSEEDSAEVEEPNTEADEPKNNKSKSGSKLGKKKDAEPEEDEFDEQAREIAEETDVEDIIEALKDVDIKATKKNAVKKLAEALRKGLIELDNEDDGEDESAGEEPTEDSKSDDGEEIEADSYFPEYDPDGLNDPEEMTEERSEAVVDKMDEILTSYADNTLTDEDIQSYVEDNATEDEIELLGDEPEDTEVLKLYMELIKRTIDDEGEEHEEGEPYEIGDKNLCCGHVLKYVKKTKNYVCEHCGEEYEAE